MCSVSAKWNSLYALGANEVVDGFYLEEIFRRAGSEVLAGFNGDFIKFLRESPQSIAHCYSRDLKSIAMDKTESAARDALLFTAATLSGYIVRWPRERILHFRSEQERQFCETLRARVGQEMFAELVVIFPRQVRCLVQNSKDLSSVAGCSIEKLDITTFKLALLVIKKFQENNPDRQDIDSIYRELKNKEELYIKQSREIFEKFLPSGCLEYARKNFPIAERYCAIYPRTFEKISKKKIVVKSNKEALRANEKTFITTVATFSLLCKLDAHGQVLDLSEEAEKIHFKVWCDLTPTEEHLASFGSSPSF